MVEPSWVFLGERWEIQAVKVALKSEGHAFLLAGY